jgi:hypothetical protein
VATQYQRRAFLVNLTPNSPTFYWHVSTVSLEDVSVSPRALPEGRLEVWMRRVVGDPVKRIMEINLYGGIDWILDSN